VKIRSKYASSCPWCGEPWQESDPIANYFDGEQSRWAHPECARVADVSAVRLGPGRPPGDCPYGVRHLGNAARCFCDDPAYQRLAAPGRARPGDGISRSKVKQGQTKVARRITARFAGHCPSCDGPIEVGETIRKPMRGAWVHVACATDQSARAEESRELPAPVAELSEYRRAAEQQADRRRSRSRRRGRG